MNPGRKDHAYVGKKDVVKAYVGKKDVANKNVICYGKLEICMSY